MLEPPPWLVVFFQGERKGRVLGRDALYCITLDIFCWASGTDLINCLEPYLTIWVCIFNLSMSDICTYISQPSPRASQNSKHHGTSIHPGMAQYSTVSWHNSSSGYAELELKKDRWKGPTSRTSDQVCPLCPGSLFVLYRISFASCGFYFHLISISHIPHTKRVLNYEARYRYSSIVCESLTRNTSMIAVWTCNVQRDLRSTLTMG